MLSETVGVYVGLDANFGSRSHLTLFLSHPPSLNPTAGGGGGGSKCGLNPLHSFSPIVEG